LTTTVAPTVGPKWGPFQNSQVVKRGAPELPDGKGVQTPGASRVGQNITSFIIQVLLARPAAAAAASLFQANTKIE